MRVTSHSYTDTLVSNLARIGGRHLALQTQIATGQRVQSAADDPLAMQQALQLRDSSAQTGQYQKNIQNHQEWAGVTHGVLKSLAKILDRSQEIAHLADGIDSDEDLRAYASEISELIKQAVHVSNTKYRGEFVLSGTKSDTEAFTAAVDSDGHVSEVVFNGNSSLPASEISEGVAIASKVTGANLEGSGERGLFSDSRFGADLFGHLIQLQNQLLSGDTDGIAQTTRADLQTDEDNLLYHVANNAALQTRLESTLSSAKNQELEIEGEISRRTDIDMAETIVRLNQAQTSYQAALQSGGTILDLNLLSFLR